MTDRQTMAQALVEKALKLAAEATLVGKDELIIWGGEFLADRLAQFLAQWGSVLQEKLPWRMYEYVHAFKVLKASALEVALPSTVEKLERARLFGAAGDLDLRRDGTQFRWRFIGNRDDEWPRLESEFAPRDFWQGKPDSFKFHQVRVGYFQWRAHPQEQRVDWSWRKTAGLADGDQYLTQLQYLHNGRIEFVRYTGFSDKEVDNG